MKRLTVTAIALFLIVLPTCGIAQDKAGPRYTDKALGFTVSIANPSWSYYQDRGQVYFCNGERQNDNSLISLSSQPVSGDVATQMDLLWRTVRGSLSGMEVKYSAMKAIMVGGDDQARLYAYEIQKGGERLICYCAFWQAGGMLYLCTTSADEGTAGEVRAALDSLLGSFQILP